MKVIVSVLLLLFSVGCSVSRLGTIPCVEVPFNLEDTTGAFVAELRSAISQYTEDSSSKPKYVLLINSIVDDVQDVGFDFVLGTESLLPVQAITTRTVSVSLKDRITGEYVFQNVLFEASNTFDFANDGNMNDLSVAVNGDFIPSVEVSQGRLDSYEGASDESINVVNAFITSQVSQYIAIALNRN